MWQSIQWRRGENKDHQILWGPRVCLGDEHGGSDHETVETKLECGIPWRIEATGILGQWLFFFIRQIVPLLLIIANKGRAAGERRGLLKTDSVGTVCERVSTVERIGR
jgi:hypothetical protein